MELQGSGTGGRSKKKFMEVIRDDIHMVGVAEKDIRDRGRRRLMIRCGDS